MDSPEWIDLDGWLAGLQERPVVLQFGPVDLRPRLNKTLLRLRQAAAEAFDRVDGGAIVVGGWARVNRPRSQ